MRENSGRFAKSADDFRFPSPGRSRTVRSVAPERSEATRDRSDPGPGRSTRPCDRAEHGGPPRVRPTATPSGEAGGGSGEALPRQGLSGPGPGGRPGDREAERPALGPDRHPGAATPIRVEGGPRPTSRRTVTERNPPDGRHRGGPTDREEGPGHRPRGSSATRHGWGVGSDGIPSAEQTGDGRFRWQTGLPPRVGRTADVAGRSDGCRLRPAPREPRGGGRRKAEAFSGPSRVQATTSATVGARTSATTRGANRARRPRCPALIQIAGRSSTVAWHTTVNGTRVPNGEMPPTR